MRMSSGGAVEAKTPIAPHTPARKLLSIVAGKCDQL
jgi:hypothetical protein